MIEHSYLLPLDQERAESFATFQRFVELGPKCTLPALTEAVGKPLRTAEGFSMRHN